MNALGLVWLPPPTDEVASHKTSRRRRCVQRFQIIAHPTRLPEPRGAFCLRTAVDMGQQNEPVLLWSHTLHGLDHPSASAFDRWGLAIGTRLRFRKSTVSGFMFQHAKSRPLPQLPALTWVRSLARKASVIAALSGRRYQPETRRLIMKLDQDVEPRSGARGPPVIVASASPFPVRAAPGTWR